MFIDHDDPIGIETIRGMGGTYSATFAEAKFQTACGDLILKPSGNKTWQCGPLDVQTVGQLVKLLSVYGFDAD